MYDTLNPGLTLPLSELSAACLTAESVTVDDWGAVFHGPDGDRRAHVWDVAEFELDVTDLRTDTVSAIEARIDADDYDDRDAIERSLARAEALPSTVTVELATRSYYPEDTDANRKVLADALVEAGFDFDRAVSDDFAAEFDFHEVEGDEIEGPVMNYYYPLPAFSKDEAAAALAIADLPLCLVEFEDGLPWGADYAYALALTGGGMNLAWQIQEAHLRLGYLAPEHATQFPWKRDDDAARYVMKAAVHASVKRTALALMRGSRIAEEAQTALAEAGATDFPTDPYGPLVELAREAAEYGDANDEWDMETQFDFFSELASLGGRIR